MADRLDADRNAFPNPPRQPAGAPPRPGRAERFRSFLSGVFSTDLKKTPLRLKLVACVFFALYATIAGRLIFFGMH